MTKNNHQFFGFGPPLFALFAPVAAHAADGNSRLAQEAKALFAFALADDPSPQHCEYSAIWATDPIPEFIARAHFGLTLHAGLAPPDSAGKPQDVLDPVGKYTSAFCSPEETSRYETELVGSLGANPQANVLISHTTYTFPVFDANYQKAAVVASHMKVIQTPSGATKYPLQTDSVVLIFVKARSKWRLVETKLLSAS
ncbi:MAG: hypothetical protein P4M15_10210 [Alphaproteobacteria bacterium]|nr:hypothetical protein [Alphaproteobacteria bacterium]